VHPDSIPRAEFAVIGGSGTFSISFPEDLEQAGIQVIATGLVFTTPFGESPSFKLFKLDEKKVLTVRMHGWRSGVSRASASQQVFWVLREAGIKKVIAEGGVGSINRLLRPGDLLVPSDYLDFSMRKDVGLGGEYLLTMRRPVCPLIKRELVAAAEKSVEPGRRVFNCGVYAVTDGRHFESPAEVAMLGRLGADIVGQSMCPEVYLAREIGACYGRLDIVSNYAEGVVREWDHRLLKDIFYNEAIKSAKIILKALSHLDPSQVCGCPNLRLDTLLRDKTEKEEIVED